MNADRWGRSIFRFIDAVIAVLFFCWAASDFTASTFNIKFIAVIYCVTYLFLYVKDVACELNERLKELGAYLETDSEFGEHDSSI